MNNPNQREINHACSPAAVRVIQRLDAGDEFGHAVQIWNTAVRLWISKDPAQTYLLTNSLADLISYDPSWESYGDDIQTLLVSYETFKFNRTRFNDLHLRMLSTFGRANGGVSQVIQTVEAAVRSLEATEVRKVYQRTRLNVQGPMGGSGGGWTC